MDNIQSYGTGEGVCTPLIMMMHKDSILNLFFSHVPKFVNGRVSIKS